MFITATGSGIRKREIACDIAHFCALSLMPRLENKLYVNLRLIYGLREKESLAGDCIWEDDTCTRPREFTVRVDSSQTMQEMLETIAHEMVHVKQYARGELKDFARTTKLCKWKGKTMAWEKMKYYDLPWEIEAHGRERGLFIAWFEQSQWKKCNWANY
jgi:hypothetical protein